MKNWNDIHPRPWNDNTPWQEAKPDGQFRFARDVTRNWSWQCKYGGMTVYGLKSEAEALAKIAELRQQKIMSSFFSC